MEQQGSKNRLVNRYIRCLDSSSRMIIGVRGLPSARTPLSASCHRLPPQAIPHVLALALNFLAPFGLVYIRSGLALTLFVISLMICPALLF